MSEEDGFLPLSALQHMLFCERQAALIHLEGIWLDNARTIEGTDLHRVADAGRAEQRGSVLIRRGLTLRSARLRLRGKADVVEFHRASTEDPGRSCELGEQHGWWRPFPVEYKRGRPKRHRADEVQLCAQAMCLEEALSTEVSTGALFYAEVRRRQEVTFDDGLRRLTEDTALRLHDMMASSTTPLRPRDRRCDHCSLLPVCLPPKRSRPSVEAYLEAELDPPPLARSRG